MPKIKKNEICSCGPDRRGSSPVDDNFCFVLFLTFWYVMHYFSFSCSDFEKLAKIDVQNCKIRIWLCFCLDPGGVHCVTFTATPITTQL